MLQAKLFPNKATSENTGSYYIVKLTNEVSYSSTTVRAIRDLVSESDDLYPGIDIWFDRKVLPGIKEGKRFAYLVMHQGKPIAEMIVKRGKDTKLCSMRIKPAYQNKAIGPFLFAQITSLLDSSTPNIHFTAPESLVEEREGMFEKLGFVRVGKSSRVYRPGEDEFVFRAESDNFKKRALWLRLETQEHQLMDNELMNGKIPKPIVLSVHPKHAKKIAIGKKTVEIRRKFSRKLAGTIAFIYASKPIQAVVAETRISAVVEGKPRDIWEIFAVQIGCTRQEFNEYCRGEKKVFALILDEILPYGDPLPWSVFSAAFDAPIGPPQSYGFLKPSGFTEAKHIKVIDSSTYKRAHAVQIPLF